MGVCRIWIGRLGLAAGVVWACSWCGMVSAQEHQTITQPAFAPVLVSLKQLAPEIRDGVRLTIEHPILTVHGPTEVFCGNLAIYRWLLDHPDRAVRMWRCLGARCMEITDRGNGRFGWDEVDGSDIQWQTIRREPALHIWYAEGNGKASSFLPSIHVRAVAVLRFKEICNVEGQTFIQHQADLYVQTDSKAAALIAKLLGPSAPQLARQSTCQLELFFSALVWYLDQHLDHGEALLAGNLPPNSALALEVRRLVNQAMLAKQGSSTPID